jgi:histidinol dehydrogenase
MNVIPAHVAGVGEIIMVVPTPRWRAEPLVLAAAYVAGVTAPSPSAARRPWRRWPTARPPCRKVDKITGPGNAYVASAKRRVFGQVGIDMIAGPSEILVLADGSTPPDWVAMDLFSQAEHDELAQSILLCPDAAYIDAVQAPSTACCPACRARPSSAKSLNGRGALIHTRSMEEACAISNRIAPEHLEVSSAPTRTAGSRCCAMPAPSSWAPSPAKAWATTAPAPTTCCPPRARALLSPAGRVRLRQKRSSLIEVSEAGAQVLGPIAAELAYGEGLQAHAQAAEMRLKR